MGPQAHRSPPGPPETATPDNPPFVLFYIGVWIGFLLLLMGLILLAAVDIWSTRRFSVRQQRKILDARRAMLEREVGADAAGTQWAWVRRLNVSRWPTAAAVLALQPFLHPRQFLRPGVAGPPLAEYVVHQVQRLQQMAQLRHALLQPGAFVGRFRRRQPAAADRQRLRLQRQLVLLVVTHHDQADLARQLARLDGARASGKRVGPSLVMLSRPVWPRGHSSTSVRVSITAASEPSPSAIVSDSASSMYHSQSRYSLPRKSRLASSGAQATSDGDAPGTNGAGAASSTPRVCRRGFRQAEHLPAGAQRLEAVAERLLEQRVQPIQHRHGGGADEQFVGRGVPEDGARLAAQEAAVGGFLFQALLGAAAGPRVSGRRWGCRWGWTSANAFSSTAA